MADAVLNQLWDASNHEQALRQVSYSTVTPIKLTNFVDGFFSTSSSTSAQLDSVNPQNGKSYAKVPNSSANDVDAAVLSAHRAFSSWSKTSPAARSITLNKIADIIASRRNIFATWESIDQGKTYERAQIEIDRAVSNFRYFAGYILHQESAARFTDTNHLTYEHHSPKGVFALISPWNMPLYLLTWKIAPCLAFGCAAVAKPSELTSVTAFLLANVLREARLPNGVINIIFGAGAPTGKALVNHKLVKGISFTGGTATGIQIRKDTAEAIGKHLSLQLGGKNPTLVFADADLAEAVRTSAIAAFENQGEICLCGSRTYVERSLFTTFVIHFVLHVAANYKLRCNVGAVVSAAHYDKVRGYLALAKKEGAKFELGEVPPKQQQGGYWIPPTILTDVASRSSVMRDEIFGPVVTITPFDSEDEAINLANDNPNGLAAVLLTKDMSRTRRVGEQIDAGLVWVNCWLVRQLATPFGGMKSSGTGREGGAYSREVFTNVRTLHIPM
ncbi:2-aminomuconic semialdehyde dehydrogenase [Fulvia fulva]|uniref:2-aminomuconic semialdehyde dehydrogenase n=1 Tax=Passalora fulva TaxID=5499 RepID=A0A9Q8P998_PASFU|nr:2-aminomuconic semialdehyde dehydrogenase [Fulvia fulva]KAK4625498.1 2-aminomuconic semialdehyde dehydrogenase [Fulvia fulva]UJO18044.1 2-aminomuconic semialdehyde dehydrogenase [Fulvia fulva]